MKTGEPLPPDDEDGDVDAQKYCGVLQYYLDGTSDAAAAEDSQFYHGDSKRSTANICQIRDHGRDRDYFYHADADAGDMCCPMR